MYSSRACLGQDDKEPRQAMFTAREPTFSDGKLRTYRSFAFAGKYMYASSGPIIFRICCLHEQWPWGYIYRPQSNDSQCRTLIRDAVARDHDQRATLTKVI
jgi:hypothetical protein